MENKQLPSLLISVKTIGFALAISVPLITGAIKFLYSEFPTHQEFDKLAKQVEQNEINNDNHKQDRQILFEFERNKIMLVLLEAKLKLAYALPTDVYNKDRLQHKKNELVDRQAVLKQRLLNKI